VTATLTVNEVYLSVQGESTFAGLPCVFIRLTGCDLRCSYCDTAYAFREGKKSTVETVVQQVAQLAAPYATTTAGQRLPLVELTGGEPLLQRNSLLLMHQLCDAGWTVLLETSGAHPIEAIDPRVHRIVDLKCPSSGESERNCWENLGHLRSTDEVKCVIATLEDYEWAKARVEAHALTGVCPILFSWAAPLSEQQKDSSLNPMPASHQPLTRQQLVERIIADALPVRFQVQMHKMIWAPDARTV
jgi:7-carboxy-7-deazaguanine synthase